MELLVLDTDFNRIGIIDTYESSIWTDRYWSYGDFEIYTLVNMDILDLLKDDYYLVHPDSIHTMIIEERRIVGDFEDGDRLLVSGRSLESVLDRRVIWGQKVLTGSLQDGVETLLNEQIITPSDMDRQISNFIFEPSTDPNITGLTIDLQLIGDNLYQTISSICEEAGIGFKVIMDDNFDFIFSLYSGADRSYDQLTNPYVIFSPEWDNILSSEYTESKSNLKTVALVMGEGEGFDRKTKDASAPGGSLSGLNRRELFVDASDLSQTIDGGTLPDADYYAQLEQRGKEILAQNIHIKTFAGQIEVGQSFIYGKDFNMGDVVQVANDYDIVSKSRITEYIRSQTTSGFEVYPTFSAIET